MQREPGSHNPIETLGALPNHRSVPHVVAHQSFEMNIGIVSLWRCDHVLQSFRLTSLCTDLLQNSLRDFEGPDISDRRPRNCFDHGQLRGQKKVLHRGILHFEISIFRARENIPILRLLFVFSFFHPEMQYPECCDLIALSTIAKHQYLLVCCLLCFYIQITVKRIFWFSFVFEYQFARFIYLRKDIFNLGVHRIVS